jgi:hypothetical protein
MDAEKKCQTCKFWEPFHVPGSGRCRRNPPGTLPSRKWDDFELPVTLPATAWPETRPEDWCGAWEPENQ